MKYRLTISAISLVFALAILAGWRSSSDNSAYIVIVDHDVDDQRLSCGLPTITQAPNGSYFIHIHAPSGDIFLSGKVVTVSKSDTEKDACK